MPPHDHPCRFFFATLPSPPLAQECFLCEPRKTENNFFPEGSVVSLQLTG